MINRLRVILPPDSVVIIVVLIFAIAEGPFVFLEWKIQQPLDFPRPSLFILRMVAFFYGCWRFSSFHPGNQPEYRAWLERSPWTSKAALPAGPIGLVWEDALPLGGLAVMGAFLGPLVPYLVLNLFLIGYLTALVLSSFATGTRGFGYLVAFGIGLAIRYWPDQKIALAVLAVTYGFGMIGLRVALAKFPWPFYSESAQNERLQQLQETLCGWPFDQLKPSIQAGWKLRWFDGLMIGLLAGWFLFACESFWTLRSEQLVMVQLVFRGAVGALVGIRTLIYCVGYAPPISLLGRIVKFRWIIPGYDKIFLAPLCTLLVAVLAIDRFRPPGLDDLIVLPIALALAITVTIDTGPSMRSWRLTGQHRITASVSKVGGEFVKVG